MNYEQTRVNECDYYGFYPTEYIAEDLCDDCELKQYPEKFYGCYFCGKAIRYNIACWGCQKGFEDWAFDLFYNKNHNSRSTISCFAIKTDNETNNWNLWQDVGNGIHCLISSIPTGKNIKHPIRIFEIDRLNNNWPGFYEGNDRWLIPNPFQLKENIDIQDITWENGCIVLNRELEKNDIYIYDGFQIKNPKNMVVVI